VKLKISFLWVVVLFFSSGCNFESSGSSSASLSSGTVSSATTTSCSASESLIEDDTSIAISANQEIAQQLYLISTNNTTTSLSSVTVHMSSSGLTQVTMKIYQSGSQPEQGTLLGTSSLTTGLGSSASTSPLTFAFTGLTLNPNQYYYFVISAVGGSFNASESTAGNSLWEKSSGTWSTISYGLSMSISWNCL
jgi:hypothetical protein